MILKRRDVKRARKQYECCWCERTINIGDPYTYLYGMADSLEKPYALHYCQICQAENDRIQGAQHV